MAWQAAFCALRSKFSDRDFIVISKTIARDLHSELSKVLSEHKTRPNCTVFLTTYGGDPDAGYRIARCLRHYYRHIRLVVPSFCKSAGTLITICADVVVIGDQGELGPLDIQVRKSSELAERSSGLDIIQALQAGLDHVQQAFRQNLIDIRNGGRLSTKLAGEFATKIAVGIAAPLYAQIDPNRLGEMQRAMRIAHEYGQRLDRYTQNLKHGALDQLVAEYPSHSFVIDRKEASELFHRVEHPVSEETDFFKQIWHIVESETNFGPWIPEVEENQDDQENSAVPAEDDKVAGDTAVDSVAPAKADGEGG